MRKIIINQNEKGLLFKNGKYVKMLSAGKYYTYGGRNIEVMDAELSIKSERCQLDTLLSDKAIADTTVAVEVSATQLALHFIDGKFAAVLRNGKYAFWTDSCKHEFTLVDISTPYVDESVPAHVLSKLPSTVCTKIEVAEYQKGRLFFDRKFQRILDAGTYYFWKTATDVSCDLVDTRLTQLNISGQEMLTRDKVTLRINFVCSYRVNDCVKILTEINDYEEQLRVAAQLALREYVGNYKLDEILENKAELTEFVFQKLKEKEKDLYISIYEAGVKDIILPGDVRDIMNTVLLAEKRAQANVITRREEVASTRSLLNTAKLMDENRTLYKLKELEYVERICENVGNINLTAGGNILTQLTEILKTDSN